MATREELVRRLASMRGSEPEPGNQFPLNGGRVPSVTIAPQRAARTSFSPRGVSGEIFDPALKIAETHAQGTFDNIQGLGMAMKLFEEADRLIPAEKEPSKAVLTGMRRSIGTTSIGRLTGFADEKARSYNKFRDAFGTLLARAFGERGVVTNQDVRRVMEAFPKFDDSVEGRGIQKKFVRNFLLDRIMRFNKAVSSIGSHDPEQREIRIEGPQSGF